MKMTQPESLQHPTGYAVLRSPRIKGPTMRRVDPRTKWDHIGAFHDLTDRQRSPDQTECTVLSGWCPGLLKERSPMP